MVSMKNRLLAIVFSIVLILSLVLPVLAHNGAIGGG